MRLLIASLLTLALACSPRSHPAPGLSGLLSPDGRASARLMRLDAGTPSTQVLVSMDQGRCSGGSVSSTDSNPDLRLSWLDATTLEVSAPAWVALDPAPASKDLDHSIQCDSQVINVRVRRR